MKIKIGIVSNSVNCIAQQSNLLMHGNDVQVFLYDPEDLFNRYNKDKTHGDGFNLQIWAKEHAWSNASLTVVNEGIRWSSTEDQLSAFRKMCVDCDIVYFDFPSKAKSYSRLFNLASSICTNPVIGTDALTYVIETDRDLGRSMVDELKIGNKKCFYKHKTVSFTDQNSAIQHVRKSGKTFVLKGYSAQFPTSHIDTVDRLTHLWDQLISDNAKSTDRVVLEEMLTGGTEVAFGCYFNGSTFHPQVLVNQEEKHGTDGNRGGMLTGEVGTTIVCTAFDSIPKEIQKAFKAVEPLLTKNKYRGYFDINTIFKRLNKQIKFYFLEFTCRSGYPTESTVCCALGKDYVNLLSWMAGLITDPPLFPKYIMTTSLYAAGLGNGIMEQADLPYNPIIMNSGRFSIPVTNDNYTVTGIPFLAKWDKEFNEFRIYCIFDRAYNIVVTSNTDRYNRLAEQIYHLRMISLGYMKDMPTTYHTYRLDIGKHYEYPSIDGEV